VKTISPRERGERFRKSAAMARGLYFFQKEKRDGGKVRARMDSGKVGGKEGTSGKKPFLSSRKI